MDFYLAAKIITVHHPLYFTNRSKCVSNDEGVWEYIFYNFRPNEIAQEVIRDANRCLPYFFVFFMVVFKIASAEMDGNHYVIISTLR